MMITFINAANKAPTLDEITSARYVKPEGREYPMIGLATIGGDEFLLSLNPGEDRENAVDYLNSLKDVNRFRNWKALFGKERHYANANYSDPWYCVKYHVELLDQAIQYHRAMNKLEVTSYTAKQIETALLCQIKTTDLYEPLFRDAAEGDLKGLTNYVAVAVEQLMKKNARKLA